MSSGVFKNNDLSDRVRKFYDLFDDNNVRMIEALAKTYPGSFDETGEVIVDYSFDESIQRDILDALRIDGIELNPDEYGDSSVS